MYFSVWHYIDGELVDRRLVAWKKISLQVYFQLRDIRHSKRTGIMMEDRDVVEAYLIARATDAAATKSAASKRVIFGLVETCAKYREACAQSER